MDQIEVYSKSTTSSKEYKRQKINSKNQLRLHLNQQTFISTSHNNKCSTETTSDFPVSTPSNTHSRTILQKNTISADTFEQNLALLIAQKPQMSLDEKINAWKCDLDLSDVEDVGSFDELFKEHEELKKKVVHATRNIEGKFSKHLYNFNVFRNEVLPNINAGSIFNEKTPTTSVASLSAQRRRRAALEYETKKPQQCDNFKRKGSTTPTFTSSSENDLLVNSVSKQLFNSAPHKLLSQKLDNEESENTDKLASCERADEKKCCHSPSAIVRHQGLASKLSRTSAEENSILKLCRLNRYIDKINQRKETNKGGLIQMRFDFAIRNKSKHLHEKKRQLFKTPTVPQKYLPIASPTLLPLPMPATLTAILPDNIEFSSNNANEMLSENSKMAMKITSVPPHNADRSCREFSPSSKTITSANCHQQHEFCNYLGLTGMSTANAVAHAVAELSKCNLARRSLRVRRLKQQVKQEKIPSVTKSCTKEVGSVPASPHEMMTVEEVDEPKEIISNLVESGKKSRLLTEHSSTLEEERINSVIASEAWVEKEPEIKIVCKITSIGTKPGTAPIRQTLLRHLKPNEVNSNDTSTCPRSSISDVDGDEMSSNPTPNTLKKGNLNFQRERRFSPTRNSTCSSVKNARTTKSLEDSDCIKMQLHNKFKKYLEASRKIKPSICIVQALHNPDPRQYSQPKPNCRSKEDVKETFDEKIMLNTKAVKQSKTSNKRSLAEHQQNLEESDKVVEINDKKRMQLKRRELTLLSRQKKKERLRKLLALATPWHKIKNHRQLRNRKILLVKTIRSTQNTSRKSKTDKVNPVELDSIVSSSKSEISNTRTSKFRKENHQEHKNKYKLAQKGIITSRSTPSPLDTSTKQQNLRTSNTGFSAPVRKIQTTSAEQRGNQSKNSNFEVSVLSPLVLSENTRTITKTGTQGSNLECETVVVSSTTNSYDEATLLKLNNRPSHVSRELNSTQLDAPCVITTKDSSTQSTRPVGIHFLSAPNKQIQNPIKAVNGNVDYIYYEMDVLIVIQEKLVSFWKYFKLLNVLAGSQDCNKCSYRINSEDSNLATHLSTSGSAPQWLSLGECRRLIVDTEILTSYANRICVHNSIPIYVEMRCRELPRERRDCNLLSMYINIYYFNDDDMVAKMHSIQLDAVQGLPSDVVYTTITESRYFVMSWPQENILGKPRSGLCKYSLTPNLDTLASIRDFKHMRHCIRYLECTTDDKLIGFGDTQLTIWDHRSGDVLMNYELNMKLGQNLGSIYYPSLDIGQNSILLLFQYIKNFEESKLPQILLIACSVSHTTPSHRILKHLKMPSLAFGAIQNAINTGDNIIITAKNDEEIWINCTDVTTITRVPPQHTRRFYARGRSQVIELTCKMLTVDSFANHVLKLAANPAVKYDKANHDL
ncbi:PREDICTED: uncharacterized protein LOC108358120 isoform X2 [Rhagoletis zephyria]|nr:PREDICTED: uncharacterized protein LOC108358120 isoform X2 [Rhagoletis zephyria]